MRLRKNKATVFKNKIVNVFMKNGKKHTCEKILLKSSKLLQKSSKKNFKNLVQLAIINTTSAFKLNEQVMKKGKRKSKKVTPSFIIKDSLRIMTALKFIKSTIQKNKNSNNFYKNLTDDSGRHPWQISNFYNHLFRLLNGWSGFRQGWDHIL